MRHAFRFRNSGPGAARTGAGPAPRRRRGAACATFAVTLGTALLPGVADARSAGGGDTAFTPGTYTNPISDDFADTFADPAVIKGKDGWWYSYATTDPLREGEGVFHSIPIARSRDLVDWTYVGDAFTTGTRPTYAEPTAGIWAPDVRYIDGRYVMYFGVTDTTLFAGANDSAVGVATAPTPAGPWTAEPEPVVGPRPDPSPNPDDYFWTFDSTGFTHVDGKHYLYYGSYYGGISVTELTADGLRALPSPDPQVTIGDRYEAAYVVRHDGWVYLFGSSANCCAGPTTGYSVLVGRSRSPLGPFVDREGSSFLESRAGGTAVITPNGNRWIGPGHNAVVTDYSGEDWFVYHAIDRADPYLDEPFGINERPMLMDRLDWIDGWPVVRGGAFASEGEERAPWAQPRAGDDFSDRDLDEFDGTRGRWRIVTAGEAGYAVRSPGSRGAALLTERRNPADVRAEADVRLTGGNAVGVVVRRRSPQEYAAAWLDRRSNALVTDVVVRGRHSRRHVALPAGFDHGDWHNLAVEVRGSQLYAEVTDARLNDPYAVAQRTLPGVLSRGRRAGVVADGRAQADNVGVTPLYRPNTTLEGTPTVGELAAAASDEFGDTTLGPEWSWVRTPAGEERGGQFVWPTQDADLVDPGDPAAPRDTASVLLRDAPAGNYVVETKLTIDLGVDDIRNFRQGGLIAYASDDLWARFTHVAIWRTRQLEFGKEQPFADGTSFGGITAFPAPRDTTWLRLAHRVDPANGEHEYRAGMSTDGETWTWGGVWTLPADTTPRIGLISLGGAGSTSQFDYFRVYTGGSWNG